MYHLPNLILDLALILMTAGVSTIIFKMLKQPVLLGYILAGFLVGPHFPFFPTLREIESVNIWGDMGVIFLLFALGLEFSFKKLFTNGPALGVTALIEVLFTFLIGYFCAYLMGWKQNDALFLGGIVSISSTAIIIRAFEDFGIKGLPFVQGVFGILIFEDLIAILMLVVLVTMSLSSNFSGMQLTFAVGKLAFFLTMWFIWGMFLLPSIMSKFKSYLSDETLLVVSVGLCFFMVILSTQAELSPALGAFMMGSMLSETRQGKRVEHIIVPLKNLFAAVFFVSVGMLLDPKILKEHIFTILIVSLVVILGKFIGSTFAQLITGKSRRDAVMTGVSLAQIGEFSFIIASLGATLKVTSNFLYPVAVGVSAITTLTTPYMIKNGGNFYSFIENKLPKKIKMHLDNYDFFINKISFSSVLFEFSRFNIPRIFVHSVVIISLFLGIKKFLHPIVLKFSSTALEANLVCLSIALVCSAPFLWALLIGTSKKMQSKMSRSKANHKYFILLSNYINLVIFSTLLTLLSSLFVSVKIALLVLVVTTTLLLFVFSKYLEIFYGRIETRFKKNMQENDQ